MLPTPTDMYCARLLRARRISPAAFPYITFTGSPFLLNVRPSMPVLRPAAVLPLFGERAGSIIKSVRYSR